MNRQQLRYLIKLVTKNLVPPANLDREFQDNLLMDLEAELAERESKIKA